jgi:hypothetical protein
MVIEPCLQVEEKAQPDGVRVIGPVVQLPRWFMAEKAEFAFSLAASTHMDIFWRIGTGADMAMVISHQPALRVGGPGWAEATTGTSAAAAATHPTESHTGKRNAGLYEVLAGRK